ncbi:MAG: TonB-dependent receptor [Gemmatimonadaceae bacterium]|nr:TonB-dependent receptor [Gemmatimonadaceae bacterium]
MTGVDGTPVPGARVSAQPSGQRDTAAAVREVRTGRDGWFTLAGLPAGDYRVTVRALGYGVASVTTTLGTPEGALEPDAPAPRGLDVLLTRTAALLAAQVTTATRSASTLSDIPGAVTVVDRSVIERQTGAAAGLGEVLAKTVPGLGGATGTQSTYGQPLRGRSISVLIDGVPLSTTRSVSHDLHTIDPASVERVEVLRGASAIYGDGGTGGVINIITRAPAVERLRYTTELRSSTAAGADAFGSGTAGRVAQTVAGRRGALDFQLGASFDRTGGFFDAEGDRIPPDPNGQGGLSDTRAWSTFGKAGLTRGAQRVQLALNHYDATQDTRWATAPSRDTIGKALSRFGLELETPQGSRNTVANLEYTHDGVSALAGSRLHAQLFHRDFVTVFGPAPRSLKRPSTGSTTAQTYIYQSYLDTWKSGGRAEVTTGLPGLGASVTWGGDATIERTFQGMHVFDKSVYDASQGLRFVRIDDWTWVPPMRTRSFAGFAQLEAHPLARLVVRAGLRHERDRVDVNDFVTIEEVAVQGGSLSFTPTVYNAGAVVTAGRGVELFGNFSQGFSLGDIGLTLRQAPAGFVLGTKSAEAQRVDQLEAGARGLWSRIQATASVFRSTSELGSQVDGNLRVVRAPERIRGVEATLDAQPTARLELGGSFTWSEGEFLDPKDSAWKALNGFRIAPAKTTAYVSVRPADRVQTRLQVLHSGSRDAAYLDRITLGGRRVAAYTTVDALGTVDLPRGAVTVGVENLLNRQYYPTVSQLMTSNTVASRAAARGRALSVAYRVAY